MTLKISAMTPGAALTGAELQEAVQAAATVSITTQQVRDYVKPKVYTFVVPVNAFAVTITNGTQIYLMVPAGDLATGALTMAPAPKDGEEIKIVTSGHAVTALTLNANAGQSIVGAVTTLAANANAVYLYRAANTTWYRVG